MAFDTATAARLITDEVAAAAAAAPDGVAMAASAKASDFCSLWKAAKPILETVSGFIGLIPGVGATAGAVLKGLIKVGDMIYEAQCT
ncbi:hypothetical protein EDC22_11018 [Tepidamorphus gemmatus]|uniref:Uncharacterized protein n=1 Tax=Tepidamorphus gemmatus TaxID=747076 RepID=A0A4R3M205_9HYPH|nr:hypothetical protein [Tepidamorphus gemmatus]TCT07171.1 hypothetical protein EDC22_11018 [Tepidamorphus gemmatus]